MFQDLLGAQGIAFDGYERDLEREWKSSQGNPCQELLFRFQKPLFDEPLSILGGLPFRLKERFSSTNTATLAGWRDHPGELKFFTDLQNHLFFGHRVSLLEYNATKMPRNYAAISTIL